MGRYTSSRAEADAKCRDREQRHTTDKLVGTFGIRPRSTPEWPAEVAHSIGQSERGSVSFALQLQPHVAVAIAAPLHEFVLVEGTESPDANPALDHRCEHRTGLGENAEGALLPSCNYLKCRRKVEVEKGILRCNAGAGELHLKAATDYLADLDPGSQPGTAQDQLRPGDGINRAGVELRLDASTNGDLCGIDPQGGRGCGLLSCRGA